jgi:hypothetical protein
VKEHHIQDLKNKIKLEKTNSCKKKVLVEKYRAEVRRRTIPKDRKPIEELNKSGQKKRKFVIENVLQNVTNDISDEVTEMCGSVTGSSQAL